MRWGRVTGCLAVMLRWRRIDGARGDCWVRGDPVPPYPLQEKGARLADFVGGRRKKGSMRAFWAGRLFFLCPRVRQIPDPIGGIAENRWIAVDNYAKCLIMDRVPPTGWSVNPTGWLIFPTGSICSISLECDRCSSLSLSFIKKKERGERGKIAPCNSTGWRRKPTGQTPAQKRVHGLYFQKTLTRGIAVAMKPLVGAALL